VGNRLEVKLESGPESACPVDTGGECHSRGDTDTGKTDFHDAREREERGDVDGQGTHDVEAEE
jgi:hypothetical protein